MMRLQTGLSDERLLSRIFKYHQLLFKSERALGFYLLDFDRRGLFRKHGCSGTIQFAFLKLQLPARKTRELLRVARALEELPEVDHAFATHRISWSAVRELTRVATKNTETEWVEFAESSSIRKIEQAVSRTKKGDRPCRDAYGLTQSKLKVIAELPPEDYAVWEAAFARVASIAAQGDPHLDAAGVLMVLAQNFLEQPLSMEEKEKRNAFQVVYHRCTDCERAWIMNVDGPEGISASKVAQREPMAEKVFLHESREDNREENTGSIEREFSLPDDPRGSCNPDSNPSMNSDETNDPGGSSDSYSSPCMCTKGSLENKIHAEGDEQEATEAIPLAVSTKSLPSVPMELRDKPNSLVIRNQVLLRDGQLCAAPGCMNKAELNVHHRVWRSHGGRTQEENLLCLCRECHSLVHNGLLEIKNNEQERMEGKSLRWVDSTGAYLTARAHSGQEGKPVFQVNRQDLHGNQQAFHGKHHPNVNGHAQVNAHAQGDGYSHVDSHAHVDGSPHPRQLEAIEEETKIYSLDEVPDYIDSEWWRKHGHNFQFQGRSNRIFLKSS
ncbi:MAG: HNH endonuclease signature motif containing protein [Planctomycetota bacterium]